MFLNHGNILWFYGNCGLCLKVPGFQINFDFFCVCGVFCYVLFVCSFGVCFFLSCLKTIELWGKLLLVW